MGMYEICFSCCKTGRLGAHGSHMMLRLVCGDKFKMELQIGLKLTVKTQLVYVGLFICQSDYMFWPQLGHHQVTIRLYNRGS
jgi:hypothetical protein